MKKSRFPNYVKSSSAFLDYDHRLPDTKIIEK